VCFVTCLTWPGISDSDAYVARALAERGLSVTARAWNDPHARFDGFDLVVFRSNWDYHHAPEAFARWLDRWEASGARFWNPPALIRWNLTKRYLLDLDRAGVTIVPTVILEDEGPTPLAALLAERGWTMAVVKPVVSASAHHTVLVPPGAASAVGRSIDTGEIRRPVMVQPFIEDIRTRGEWSLVFIDGRFTHSALKRPGPDDFRVQSRYGGMAVAAPAPPEVVAAGQRALGALPVPPLYARVDGVDTAGGFLLMEVELHEPGLFFSMAPSAAEALADAIIRRL
jgi:glutathione synthase/RimK-type ligase-like ATP-grasp enzyme